MTKEQRLYLSLCVEIPNMIINHDWWFEIDRLDWEQLSIFVRGDWDIEVLILDENDEEIWGGIIDMSDYDELIKWNFDFKILNELIQDKIDFAYKLCFTY